MRVYEIAKELGIGSREMVSFLKKAKFSVASHMSVLPDGAEEAARKFFTSTPVVENKKDEGAPIKTSHVAEKSHKLVHQGGTHEKVAHRGHSPAQQQAKSHPIVQAPADDSLGDTQADVKLLTDKPGLSDSLELMTGDVDLSNIAKGREKIDRFLIRKVFDDKSAPRPFRRRSRRHRQRIVEDVQPKIVTEIKLDRSMPLFEVADMMGKLSGELITVLLKRGMICNRNHVLTPDIIKNLADQFGIKVLAPDVAPQEQPDIFVQTQSHAMSNMVTRWPIVVVMGHVDHGKTTLLDYIRKRNVAGSEKGGITQHLGAYEVNSTHGKIVFLDTPGHEAFSFIRERGAKVTDIVVIVIAVDDGIKPQTLEAIKHAKDAEVPIIIAVNKVDKMHSPAALETVKRQLAQHELMPEDWGGQTIVVPISAKTGQGVDTLLEMIVLQAQMMDLKSNITLPARAFILESKVEKGYGPVATVIGIEGTLKQGDYFTCGSSTGKIRLLINSHGDKIQSIGPAVPVQVVGFDSFVSISDWLTVVSQDAYIKAKASKPAEPTQNVESSPQVAMQKIGATTKQQSLNLIIKTDTRGSKEALVGCIEKLSKLSKEVKCPIYMLTTGVGDISENDIEFANNTQSLIIGLHVKVEKNAINLAKQRGVTIQTYDIIYHVIEDLEKLLLSKKEVELVWVKVGEASVKKVFDIKGVGIIAGCYMREGVLSRDCKVVCVRNGRTLGEGKVVSLQRDKKTVKEIHAGFECGFVSDSFTDWAEGDTVLCYAHVKDKQK